MPISWPTKRCAEAKSNGKTSGKKIGSPTSKETNTLSSQSKTLKHKLLDRALCKRMENLIHWFRLKTRLKKETLLHRARNRDRMVAECSASKPNRLTLNPCRISQVGSGQIKGKDQWSPKGSLLLKDTNQLRSMTIASSCMTT